ncbi:MAG: alpha/beta hydrolase [Promethearchaeota archaeon]|nr:MAG: alpha/beta hydrolase [Candidatus Lokiarchaeota archaeon]
MPYLDYKNKKIFYQIKNSDGKNKAIIFLHASGGTSYTWKEQMAKLDVNYDLIALDLPSHGKSEDITKLSLELYVDVIKELIEILDFEQVILCGNSLGGAVVQEFYFKYPKKIIALILCGTGARLRVSPVILNSLQDDYQQYLNSYHVGAFHKKTPKEIINPFLKEVGAVDSQVAYSDYMICDNFDVMDKIHLIDVPCLVLCGTADRLTPVKYSQYFHDKIKNSELVIINDAAHHAMLEKPEEVNQAIKNFLNKYVYF